MQVSVSRVRLLYVFSLMLCMTGGGSITSAKAEEVAEAEAAGAKEVSKIVPNIPGLEEHWPYDIPQEAFVTTGGKELTISDFKGKIVVLNFWATWCGPCVAEMPSLETLHKAVKGRGIEVVAVSQDFKGLPQVEKFYKKQYINGLPAYADKKNKLFRKLGLSGLPITLIVNHDGEAVGRVDGDIDWSTPEVQAWLIGLQEKNAENATESKK